MTAEADQQPLLTRFAAGEADAAQAVLSAYGRLLWFLAWRFCRTRDDAEDAVQEILTDLWKSGHRYRSSRGSERVFVTMIARRRLIDRLRRDRRRGELEGMAAGPETELTTPGDRGEREWDAEQAARAIQHLSDDQRRVLHMSMARGMTQREIADATGSPLGTVKTHMRRGLLRLQERMTHERMTPGAPPASAAEPTQ